MKLNRILCPIDFSRYSHAANFYASFLAEASDAEIVYVNVAVPQTGKTDVEETLDDRFMQLSTRIRPMVLELRHEFEVRVGDPAKEIVQVADDRNVDLIVMGTHGRTGLGHLLHGSVCESVLRNSHCPVMAVKSDEETGWMLTDDKPPVAAEIDTESSSPGDPSTP